ncbi:hypothetical protein RRG08_047967 [Elysia crispata]|uniref:Solute carrier family 13 member 5 n=1 Tax=Elysia crispata TaxID=231223 RepID=A0AAE0ZUD0_9GAST|nr:hypothetical protein RRG08_047967 [Elysia crispata]
MTVAQYSLEEPSDGGHAHFTGSTRAHVWAWRRYIILIATPFLLAPLPAIVDGSEARCAYVVMLMAVYWFTTALPVGVTALLPIILFPTLGILDTNSTTMLYMKDTNMLFAGGLFMAVAIEYWGLHKRIALRILMLVGSEPQWLMLGLMGATWFLSMWISNTATTSMMIPITEAILQQLQDTLPQTDKDQTRNVTVSTVSGNSKETSVELQELPAPDKGDKEPNGDAGDATQQKNGETDAHHKGDGNHGNQGAKGSDPDFDRMCKGMSLCICYSATCGGIGSLTGTGPNLILKENSDLIYDKSTLSNPVTFGSWMAFGVPLSLLVVVICWFWLQIAFLGRRGVLGWCMRGEKQDAERSRSVKKLIKDEYKKLGPIVFGEGMVLACFFLLVTLWVTRDMGGQVGWGQLFDVAVKDSVPAVFVGILLFILPSTWPGLRSYSRYSHPQKTGPAVQERKITIRPLLDWPIVHEKFPWQLLFLLGGGFALSGGFDKSGLSDWIGEQLEFFRDWNEWSVLVMICYIAAACTEVTSNTAMSSVLLPIMERLASNIGSHPLIYMFPVCLSTSFAFMLPVATPPNAIVFTYGRVNIGDMMKAGVVMNILAVPCVVLMTKTLGVAVFGFEENPADFLKNTTQLVAVSM